MGPKKSERTGIRMYVNRWQNLRETERESERVCETERERERVCVCAREREVHGIRMYVSRWQNLREKERESERGRKRERERYNACVARCVGRERAGSKCTSAAGRTCPKVKSKYVDAQNRQLIVNAVKSQNSRKSLQRRVS